MSRLILSSLALFCFLSLSSQSAALTIDFSSGTYSGATVGIYTEKGFTLATPTGNHFDSDPGFLDEPVLHFHEGSGNVVENIITLTFSGGAFDLMSFDLAPGGADHGSLVENPAMIVTCSDGTSVTTTAGAGLASGQTISLLCSGITSVTFDIISTSNVVTDTHLDNIVVPEPSAALLLAIGLAGLQWKRLKRGHSARAPSPPF